jgi:hypothetical protein
MCVDLKDIKGQMLYSETTPCKIKKKELFLATDRNKQKLIYWPQRCKREGIKVLQADDNSDFVIAKTALICAESRTTGVVGEDTDILDLLCHHFCEDHEDIIFRSVKQRSGKVCRI